MAIQNAPLISDSLERLSDLVVSVNGELIDPRTLGISPLDRSYIYGDSLYEVIRTLGGVPFHMDEHLVRLKESGRLCRMDLAPFLEDYRQAMLRTLDEAKKTHAQGTDFYCRLIVSRGVGRIGFATENVLTQPQYVVIVFALKPITESDIQKGYKLKVAERLRNDPRALDPAMKSGNYLNSLLAYLEATSDKTFDDALLGNHEGFLTEGTTFNLCYLKRNTLVTPPLDIGILQGITRHGVLEQAREMGLETREVLFKKEQLYEADEVMLTSTLKGVFPVVRVDHVEIRGGKPGPKTLELRKRYEAWAMKHVQNSH